MGAAAGTPLANIKTTFQLCDSQYSCGSYAEYTTYVTVLPTVSDMNIVDPNNTVSWPGDYGYPTPMPIMVGQQAELEASPAPLLSAVVWAYETSPPASVVGSYGLNASAQCHQPRPRPPLIRRLLRR